MCESLHPLPSSSKRKLASTHRMQCSATFRPSSSLSKSNTPQPMASTESSPAKFRPKSSKLFCTMTSKSKKIPPNLYKVKNRRTSDICSNKYFDLNNGPVVNHFSNGVFAAYFHISLFRKLMFG